MKIIECVPNFSEGVNKDTIDSIAKEITSINGTEILDVDMGKDTNRTVLTFVGDPDSVIKAAFNAIKVAALLIDMKKHSGEHPRMGATDVCPLIPVSNVTMNECIKYSKILAKRVGEELEIPVFLYEESSKIKTRKNLADIRKGEYEGMVDKLKIKQWEPDFGPSIFNKKTGATAIGARNYLIAYNVNLNTKDKKIATDIALDIREAGRAKRDLKGKIIRDDEGKMIKKPGKLKYTKAVGWYIDEYHKAQVSMNLVNYKKTSIFTAFEEVRNQARKRGLRVTGSEIVGLIPKDSLVEAGLFYLKKQNKSLGIPENEVLHIAIQSLGLNDISKFNIETDIIENRINSNKFKLVNMEIKDFVDEVSIDSPAPGGGSVSALAGSLSASLISMVSNLSYGKKKYIKNNVEFENIGISCQALKESLLSLIDKDTNAFNNILSAIRLPKKTNEDLLYRKNMIEDATKNAVLTPLSIMELSFKSLKLSYEISKIGNKNSLSDAGVASEMAMAAINGAYMNVCINLKDIEDNIFVEEIHKKTSKILKNSNTELDRIRKYIYKNL